MPFCSSADKWKMLCWFVFLTIDLTYHLKFVAHVMKTCVLVTEPAKVQVSVRNGLWKQCVKGRHSNYIASRFSGASISKSFIHSAVIKQYSLGCIWIKSVDLSVGSYLNQHFNSFLFYHWLWAWFWGSHLTLWLAGKFVLCWPVSLRCRDSCMWICMLKVLIQFSRKKSVGKLSGNRLTCVFAVLFRWTDPLMPPLQCGLLLVRQWLCLISTVPGINDIKSFVSTSKVHCKHTSKPREVWWLLSLNLNISNLTEWIGSWKGRGSVTELLKILFIHRF